MKTVYCLFVLICLSISTYAGVNLTVEILVDNVKADGILSPSEISWTTTNEATGCSRGPGSPGAAATWVQSKGSIAFSFNTNTFNDCPGGTLMPGQLVSFTVTINKPGHPLNGQTLSRTYVMKSQSSAFIGAVTDPTNTKEYTGINFKMPAPTISVSNQTICLNETGKKFSPTLTNAPAGGYTIAWLNSAWAPETKLTSVGGSSNDVNIGAFGTAGSPHTLHAILRDKSTPAKDLDTATFTLTVKPLPVASITPNPAAVCSGLAMDITAAPAGATYRWIEGGTGTTAKISTGALTAAKTFKVEVTQNGCKDTAAISVGVNPNPTVTVGAIQDKCKGGTVDLTANGSGGTGTLSYSWSNGGGNTQNPTNVAVPAAGNNDYVVTVTDMKGCKVTATQKVTGHEVTVAIAGNTSVINGGTTSLTANPTYNPAGGAASPEIYSWTAGNISGATNTKTVTSNALSVASDFTVEVTDKFGCVGTKTQKVNVTGTALAGNPVDASTCQGTAVTLDSKATGGTGNYTTTTWTPSAGLLLSATTGATVQVLNTTPAGDYTVDIVIKDGVTTLPAKTINVKVKTLPTLANISSGVTINSGESTTISVDPTPGDAVCTWTPGSLVGKTHSVSPTVTTTYSVTAMKDGCTSTPLTTKVTVRTGPQLAGVPTDADGCQGSVITLNSNATGGSGDYSTTTWAPSAGLQLSATTGATVQVKNTTPAGNYTVSVVIKDGVTTLPAQTVNVTVKALPTLANISPSVTINAGASATISVDPTPGDAVCTWTPGPLVGKTHTVSPTVTTTYSVTAEKNGCTSAPLTTTVTVRTGPGLALAGDNVNGCEGEAVPELSVTATGGAGGYVFTWGPVAGITFGTPVEIAGTSRVSIVNGNTLPAGTYTIPVSVRDGDGTVQNTTIQVVITRCTCTARLAMTVGAKPCGSLTATATLTLTATGGNTYSFVLKDPLNNTVLTAVDEVGPWTYTVAFGDRGTYRVENFKGKTATVPAGCDGVVNPANLDVQFWTPPTVSAGADMSICGNDQVTLRGTGTAGVTYTWDNGAVNNVPFTPVMGTVTTYTVTGTDGHGCSATDEVVVSVNPKPTVTASVNPTEICKGETVVLTPGGDADTYTWNNGGVSGIPVAPANTIRYTVTGTVTGTGCSDTASVLVKVNQAPEIISVTPANKIKRIAIGKDAVLSVEAIGENLSYQWWRQADGSDVWTELMNATTGYPQIMGVATPELSLKVVPQSWHNSKLKCIVTNACGSAEAEFSLSVSECFEITGDLVMGQGIMPDAIPGDAIDGWYCIGTRIALHAKIFQEEGYTIDNPHYKWFIDGEPAEKVIESDSSTLSWIPEFWEDDIVVKVCMYSDGACEEVCTKYIRLKARPFADAKVKILTSIDPERSFCPGEVIDFSVSTKGEGSAPEFHWYNDIFDMGIGRNKVLTMTEEDTWIKVEMRPSSEICIKDQFVADTIHLTVKKSVTPTLSLSNSINNDTVACRGDKVIFTAVYTNAGAKPLIKWQGDVWNLGTGPTAEVTLNDKDVWVKCELYPSHDVCYGKDTLVAIMPLRVLEDISVTITSDMADKNPGDEITFVSEVKNFIENMKYEWFVNRGLVEDDEEDYIGYNLRSGDIVYCAVSGNQICQTRVLSNEIEVKFGNVSRDTIVEIYKNERIKKLDLFKIGDEDKIFVIPNDGRPAFGIANITAKGSFNYTPAFDFSGNDMVRYLVRDKFDKDRVEEGYVYISVKENSRFFVPNIITPNGDGLNDTWILDFLSEYPNHTVTIYNDRGNPVFVAKNYQNDWDGSGQSNTGYISQFNLPNGIYTYVIDLGNKTQLKSWIEIRADFNRGKFR